MRKVDIATGVFFILLGIFGITQSVQLDMTSFRGAASPGPGVYPLLLSITLTGLGVLLVGSRLRGEPAQFGEFDRPERGALARVIAVMAAVAVSIALLPFAGYFLSTLALVALLLFGIERLFTWRALVTVFALPTMFFVLFVVLLRVRLPSGFIDL